ncbi:ABC-three component system middle component 2 [uncultured Bradyrhizobium sp.]|uniref:ABC-three component system middle component 2 n=1 Tax=uncultured Bradyrhizobium sp. TaxID=199684 RepID=UPI0035CAC2D9
MDAIESPRRQVTFNGPLEAGIRAVALLGAAYPIAFDLQRLTALDYLLVRTKTIQGGPESLHPPTPLRSPDAEVRRGIVQKGLKLMMSRDLVEREAQETGLMYIAGENAAAFLDALQSPYLLKVKDRARWLIEHFSGYSDAEFNELIRRYLEDWIIEFQEFERSIGGS